MVPMTEKNTPRKENYRLISLMNSKAKFSTNTRKQNSTQIARITYHDLVGYIPRMQAWFNIKKPIDINQ